MVGLDEWMDGFRQTRREQWALAGGWGCGVCVLTRNRLGEMEELVGICNAGGGNEGCGDFVWSRSVI